MAILLRDLTVAINTPPGAGATRRFTLVDDGVPTAVTCDIAGTGLTCDSGVATAKVDPGSRVEIKSEVLAPGNDAAAATPVWGFRATTL